MKKNIKKIFIKIAVIIITIIITELTVNSTFLKDNYDKKIAVPRFSYLTKEEEGSITLKTLKKEEKVQEFINSYLEGLTSCYDESYFYDKNGKVTITKYNIKNHTITIEYSDEYLCQTQYVLEDNWLTNIQENATIEEAIISKCSLVGTLFSCNEKNITDMNQIYNITATHIETKDNIAQAEDNTYIATITYILDNNPYTLNITVNGDNEYLLYKVIDANDHPKNALYEVETDPYSTLETIYNNF